MTQVCREAVVRVCHERAGREEGLSVQAYAGVSNVTLIRAGDESEDSGQLRAVSPEDFKAAMAKLRASVDDTGRETARVVEWNEKVGGGMYFYVYIRMCEYAREHRRLQCIYE